MSGSITGENSVVSKKVLQHLIDKLEYIINNYCWDLQDLDNDDINELFDANQEEITYYNSLINDNLESKNFLWSSSQIMKQITSAIALSADYTDNLIKNLGSIKLQYVEILPDSGDSNTIYILKNSDSSKNDTLNLYDNKWITIGDFSVDLNEYIKKSTYESDMESKANKSEVVSIDSVKTDITDNNLTNSDILGALSVKTAINDKMDKKEIITQFSSSVTNDQIASAKLIYDNIKNNNLKSYTDITQLGLNSNCSIADIFNALPQNSVFNSFVSRTYWSELPDQQGLLTISKTTTAGFDITFKRSGSGSKTANTTYIGQLKGLDGSDLSFDRICTSKVADVSATEIKFNSGFFNSDIKAYYEVRNGECRITFMNGTFLSTLKDAISNKVIATGLPIPSIPQVPFSFSPWASNDKQVIFFVNNVGNLIMHTSANMANACVFSSFSYFVKNA